MNANLIGKYVVVRCRDAGVHCGELIAWEGRVCILRNSRRLWYWKPSRGKWLDAVAIYGLDGSSKIGITNPGTKVLTEDCEIIGCTEDAERSIRGLPDA